MSDLTVFIECDHSAAPSLGVTLGEGWARVTLRGGARPAAPAALRRARAMLKAGAPEALGGPLRVGVTGPDAPAGAELADLVCQASRAWAEAGEDVAPAKVPHGIATGAPPGTLTAVPPGALTAAAFGVSAPSPAPTPASAVGAPRWAGADAGLVEAMARTVRASIAKHGASPDFHLGRSGDREKVYNYIRSTTARQQVPDELVEAVRCRLIDPQ